MIVSINQPAYLPWLGYFERIAASDIHIELDHVQFEKNSFTNRNRILCGAAPCWLTVPVLSGGKFGAIPIREIEIDAKQDWAKKHWQTIKQQYQKTPFFAPHAEFFEATYQRHWSHLAELLEHLTSYMLAQFRIDTPIRRSSEMHPVGTKSALVLELCRAVGATTYLSGAMGRNYLNEAEFAAAGIDVVYQDYQHPVYPRTTGTFQPNLAAIDLLFQCGPLSHDILMAGNRADGNEPPDARSTPTAVPPTNSRSAV